MRKRAKATQDDDEGMGGRSKKKIKKFKKTKNEEKIYCNLDRKNAGLEKLGQNKSIISIEKIVFFVLHITVCASVAIFCVYVLKRVCVCANFNLHMYICCYCRLLYLSMFFFYMYKFVCWYQRVSLTIFHCVCFGFKGLLTSHNTKH